jgi:hypothetical protein
VSAGVKVKATAAAARDFAGALVKAGERLARTKEEDLSAEPVWHRRA